VPYISQGSVATHLNCGGMFNDDFITNLLPSLTVEEFWKSQHLVKLQAVTVQKNLFTSQQSTDWFFVPHCIT